MAKITDIPYEVKDAILTYILRGKTITCNPGITTGLKIHDLVLINSQLFSSRQVAELIQRECTLIFRDDTQLRCLTRSLSSDAADAVKRLHICTVNWQTYWLVRSSFKNLREITLHNAASINLELPAETMTSAYIPTGSQTEINTVLEDLTYHTNKDRKVAETRQHDHASIRKALQADTDFDQTTFFNDIIDRKIFCPPEPWRQPGSSTLAKFLQNSVESGIEVILHATIFLRRESLRRAHHNGFFSYQIHGRIKCFATFHTVDMILRIHVGHDEVRIPQIFRDELQGWP